MTRVIFLGVGQVYVERAVAHSGRAQSMDVKSASFLRYEKERELNELIAKGLRNLNELRQPDVPLGGLGPRTHGWSPTPQGAISPRPPHCLLRETVSGRS